MSSVNQNEPAAQLRMVASGNRSQLLPFATGRDGAGPRTHVLFPGIHSPHCCEWSQVGTSLICDHLHPGGHGILGIRTDVLQALRRPPAHVRALYSVRTHARSTYPHENVGQPVQKRQWQDIAHMVTYVPVSPNVRKNVCSILTPPPPHAKLWVQSSSPGAHQRRTDNHQRRLRHEYQI